MKKNQHAIMIILIALIAFLITAVEGYVYYADYEQQIILRLVFTLQNSISVFVFSPMVNVSDIMDSMSANPNIMDYVFLYGYAIALFVAQLCTVTALFATVKELLLKGTIAVLTNKRNRNPLLVFGYNEKVKHLLENIYRSYQGKNAEKYTVTVVTDQKLSENEKLKLTKNRVRVFELDILSLNEKELKLFAKKIKGTDRVILFEESALRNFSIYTLIDKKACLKASIQPTCYLYCEDDGFREIVEDYHRERCETDISIFNLAEIKVKDVFKNDDGDSHSLVDIPMQLDEAAFLNNSSLFDVHLLILGFGSVGEQVLLHTLNMGVVHSRSRIWIDIVDYDALKKDDFFMKRFHPNYIHIIEQSENSITYSLTGEQCDGELWIRFHSIDIRSKRFPGLLDKMIIDEDGKPFLFTRVVASFKDMDNLAWCIIEMKKHLNKVDATPIEMTVCAELNVALVEYFDHVIDGKNVDKIRIRVAGSDKEAISLDNIIDREKEKKAKEYACIYNRIYSAIGIEGKRETLNRAKITQDEININWKCRSYENKKSSYSLSEHDDIKKQIMKSVYHQQDYGDFSEKIDHLIYNEQGAYIQDEFIEKLVLPENVFIYEMIRLEHRRWNYFSAINGWGYVKQISSQKQMRERLHPCLCCYENLIKMHPDKVVFDIIPFLVEDFEEVEKNGTL